MGDGAGVGTFKGSIVYGGHRYGLPGAPVGSSKGKAWGRTGGGLGIGGDGDGDGSAGLAAQGYVVGVGCAAFGYIGATGCLSDQYPGSTRVVNARIANLVARRGIGVLGVRNYGKHPIAIDGKRGKFSRWGPAAGAGWLNGTTVCICESIDKPISRIVYIHFITVAT